MGEWDDLVTLVEPDQRGAVCDGVAAWVGDRANLDTASTVSLWLTGAWFVGRVWGLQRGSPVRLRVCGQPNDVGPADDDRPREFSHRGM